MRAVVLITCRLPRPKTRRFMVTRRSKESSKSNQEEQEHDSQFAKRGNCLLISEDEGFEKWKWCGERTQNIGAEKKTNQQKTQYGIDAKAHEQGDDQSGGAKNDQEFPIMPYTCCFHGPHAPFST